MNDLRTRIATAIMDTCHGLYVDDAVNAADAVIAELAIREETQKRPLGAGFYRIQRYVTEWEIHETN